MTETTSENVDLIRRLYAAFRAADYDTFATLCAAEIEWIQNEGFPYGGRHVGPQAVIDGVFLTLPRYWDGFAYDVNEMLDAGNRVVVLGAYVGTHRETGKSFRAETTHVFDIADGLVTRFRQYTDTAIVRDAATPGAGASQAASPGPAHADILCVIDHYLTGARSGSSERMSEAFHPNATMYGHLGDELFGGPIETLYEWHDKNGPAPDLRANVAVVDQHGSVATVRVEIDDWTGMRFTDAFTLLRTDGRWQIVNKVFHLHTGDVRRRRRASQSPEQRETEQGETEQGEAAQ